VASKSSTPPPLSVLVAEDHPVVLEGLAVPLVRDGGFAVTGHATTGREVRAQVERQSPQVLVLDLMLQDEDGLALIKDLAALAPRAGYTRPNKAEPRLASGRP
jgi:DNA-binding NarL/FixJ family response regulator